MSQVSEPIVRIRGLRKSFGTTLVLDGVNLDVARGEAVVVIGPSGSGKTSLLMLLAGLERATSGAVTVNGAELGALDEDALARFRRRTMGIVFQSFHLIQNPLFLYINSFEYFLF